MSMKSTSGMSSSLWSENRREVYSTQRKSTTSSSTQFLRRDSNLMSQSSTHGDMGMTRVFIRKCILLCLMKSMSESWLNLNKLWHYSIDAIKRKCWSLFVKQERLCCMRRRRLFTLFKTIFDFHFDVKTVHNMLHFVRRNQTLESKMHGKK